MSWPVIALMVLIGGMMAWPIVLLKPTSAQKQRIALRQQVSQLGITLQMRPVQLPDSLQQQYSSLGHCVGYSRPLASSLLDSRYIALRSQQRNNDWFWINQKRPPAVLMQAMLDYYATLPDYCLAVEQSSSGSTLFALESRIVPGQLPALLDGLNQIIQKKTPYTPQNNP